MQQAKLDPTALSAAQRFLGRLTADYPITEARLFGSHARGEAHAESDVDIALVLSGPKGRSSDVGPEMVAKGFDVILDSGLFISPLPIWEDEWRHPARHANPWLVRAIKREGVPLER